MKKAIIILAIISASITILFAQIPAQTALPDALAPAEEAIVLTETVMSPDDGLGADEVSLAEELGEDARIQEGRISLLLKDAELKDVIRMFSTLSGANVIVPALDQEETPLKKMDVNLDNVEWQPALEAILDTQDLELYEKIPASKVYSIRKKAPGAPEATELEIFKLDYASVDSVTNLLARMIGPTGSCSIFPERNVIVVQATAKTLQGIGLVMEQVDLPRQQVFIESKFLELTDTARRDLGINWGMLSGYQVGIGGMQGTYDYTDSRMDILGLPGTIAEDIPVPGLNGASLNTLVSEVGVSTLDAATVARTLGATLSVSDFKLILSALEQNDGVEVVSNPKIIVANEEEASIHIGTKEPNILIEQRQGTQDSPGAELSVQIDQREPYFYDGVKVIVKPTINTASNILVRITTEITTFIDRKRIYSDQNQEQPLVDYPVSRVKRVDTVFSLKSGQTAAIGGLTQVSDTTKESKIPLLGSIPLLGRFFSYEHKVRDQNETIIFVTVSLANPSSIDIGSGLPQNTQLAQRYQIRENADLRIDEAELDVLQAKENVAMKKEMSRLRAANQKLIEKEKNNASVEEIIEALEAEPIGEDAAVYDADLAEAEDTGKEM